MSLHQVGHYIRQGLPGPSAAIMASVFALAQVPGGLLWSAITRRIPVRFVLAISGFCVALGAMGTALSSTLAWGILSAAVIGSGVGGLHLLLRLAWADYYGRQHLGTIRGITLPVQIGGQAVGPSHCRVRVRRHRQLPHGISLLRRCRGLRQSARLDGHPAQQRGQAYDRRS